MGSGVVTRPSNTFQTGAFVRSCLYTLVFMDRSGSADKNTRLFFFVLQPQTSLRLVFISMRGLLTRLTRHFMGRNTVGLNNNKESPGFLPQESLNASLSCH